MTSSEHDNCIVPARGESSPQRGENLSYPADEFAAMDDALFAQISQLIKESHARVSSTVNAEMTELYWQVGNAINENVLDGTGRHMGRGRWSSWLRGSPLPMGAAGACTTCGSA